MFRVGIIGDIILDILLSVDGFPVEDSEVVLKGEQFRLGGSAFNTAYELNPTELQPLLLATYGKDTAGEFVKEALQEVHLDNAFIYEIDTNTGKIYILLSPDGKRTMISSRSDTPIPLDKELYKAFIEKIDWLHVSGYLLSVPEQYECAIFAMKMAKENNLPVSLDPGTNTLKNNPEQLLQALRYTDYFLPNREEFNLLHYINGYERLTDQNNLIIKDGCKGVCYITAATERHIPAKNILRTNNSIGAGDAFNAGFILGMLSTGDLKRACEKGNEFAYNRLLKETR